MMTQVITRKKNRQKRKNKVRKGKAKKIRK